MPKKAQLPPGAAGRSQQTLARRNRRDALGKWLRRYAGVAAVAVLAWAAKTAWPRARRKLFPRKPSRRASRAKTAAAIETTAEAAAEWAVVQARADAAVARGAPHEAIPLYRDAIQLAPALSPAYTNLCHALKLLGEYADALQMCTEGYARAKDDRERAAALVNYGVAQYSGGGARYFRSAIAAWSKASSQDPANAAAHRYYAKAGVALGKLREAAEAEKLAWTVDPRPETVLALAHLATSTNASTGDAVGVDLLRSGFGDPAALDGFAESLQEFAAQATKEGSPADLAAIKQAEFVYLDYSKAEPERAWASLVAANAARRDAAPPHIVKGSAPEISEGAATDFIRAFPGGAKAKQKRADRKKADQDLLDHVAGDASIELKDEANKNRPSPVEGPAQLFIMGAPRSGGTLLHAALSRHDGIATDGDATPVLADLAAERGLAFFDRASEEDLADLGRAYRRRHHARAVSPQKENASFAIDAALENVWWLGAAAQYLEAEAPDFKALIIRRDPKAVAFSCYKAAFANGERAWADKPEDLGARLHAIRKLEDHWLKTMPDRVKLVEYEKLISNPQKVLNDVVAWLGLETCELCLTPNETEVALTSYGAVEARAPPFHTQSLAAWKRYEKQLKRDVFPHLVDKK